MIIPTDYYVNDVDYAEDIIPGEVIHAEQVLKELFDSDTQPDTTLADALAATNNEEHYNQVLCSFGVTFHDESSQFMKFAEKGNLEIKEQLVTDLPNGLKGTRSQCSLIRPSNS